MRAWLRARFGYGPVFAVEALLVALSAKREMTEAIERSEYRDAFMAAVGRFAAKVNGHEHVDVHWWHAPYVYVGVIDGRKHYPCNSRALISFDLTDGTWAGLGGGKHYVFARKGWGAFVDSVARFSVPRYKECAEPTRPVNCPPAAA